jgi:hypothetical protein
MNDETFSKPLQFVLKEMCSKVGAKYKSIDFKKENWYYEYSWSREVEKEFVTWLTEYLYKDIQARKAIMEYPIKRKKSCEKAAEAFVFNYGWGLEKD